MKQAVIERGRAEFALNAVKRVAETADARTKKEYKSYARKFPSLVLSNGLAAAVAFAMEKSAKSDAWRSIYENITAWLTKNGYFSKQTALESYVCALDSDTYRMVMNEVLALFGWLRRFASGLIEGEPDA